MENKNKYIQSLLCLFDRSGKKNSLLLEHTYEYLGKQTLVFKREGIYDILKTLREEGYVIEEFHTEERGSGDAEYKRWAKITGYINDEGGIENYGK